MQNISLLFEWFGLKYSILFVIFVVDVVKAVDVTAAIWATKHFFNQTHQIFLVRFLHWQSNRNFSGKDSLVAYAKIFPGLGLNMHLNQCSRKLSNVQADAYL